MEWTSAQFRGFGLVMEWMRDRWHYASLVALHAQPMSPAQLMELFLAARDPNVSIFGTPSIYQEMVTRHLASLTKGGLIEAGPRTGRNRQYRATGLGTELLASLDASAEFSRAHYEWLVMYGRLQRHLDPTAPIPGPDPYDSPEMAEERVKRRAVALLYGELLAPKWTCAVLAALSGGLLRFSQIIETVNEAVGASPDLASGHLADSALTVRLEALQSLTLVDRRPLSGRTWGYALTVRGHELVTSLEPVAEFGIRRDAEMTAAVLAM